LRPLEHPAQAIAQDKRYDLLVARSKLTLPLFDALAKKAPPTLENARKRLGGKASARGALLGSVVRIKDNPPAVGIVLHARDDDLDVLLGPQMVRRTKLELTEPASDGDVDAQLLAEVRSFASLTEGQRVSFPEKDGMSVGLVVEKCRYGALIAKDDGRILAVGFRKLWPLPAVLA
jgi:hypothetical protein